MGHEIDPQGLGLSRTTNLESIALKSLKHPNVHKRMHTFIHILISWFHRESIVSTY